MGSADKFIVAGAFLHQDFSRNQGVSLMQNCRVNGILHFYLLRVRKKAGL